MAAFKVLHNHILHDGVLYAPGETIELDEREAEGLPVAVLRDAGIREPASRKKKK